MTHTCDERRGLGGSCTAKQLTLHRRLPPRPRWHRSRRTMALGQVVSVGDVAVFGRLCCWPAPLRVSLFSEKRRGRTFTRVRVRSVSGTRLCPRDRFERARSSSGGTVKRTPSGTVSFHLGGQLLHLQERVGHPESMDTMVGSEHRHLSFRCAELI